MAFQSARDGWRAYLTLLWLSNFHIFLLNFWVSYWSAPYTKHHESSSKQGCGLSHLFYTKFATFTENSAEHGTFTLHPKSRQPPPEVKLLDFVDSHDLLNFSQAWRVKGSPEQVHHRLPLFLPDVQQGIFIIMCFSVCYLFLLNSRALK